MVVRAGPAPRPTWYALSLLSDRQVRTAFRPSDDAALLPFNIPGNLMLVGMWVSRLLLSILVNLRRAATILLDVCHV